MQNFLKMNKHEISKNKKRKKKHIIFSKIAIYKNRAYKYCTANCLQKYSAAEFLVLQTMSVEVHKHNQC